MMEKGLFPLLEILKSRLSTLTHTQLDARPLLSQDRPADNKNPLGYIQISELRGHTECDSVVAHII